MEMCEDEAIGLCLIQRLWPCGGNRLDRIQAFSVASTSPLVFPHCLHGGFCSSLTALEWGQPAWVDPGIPSGN